MYFLLILTFKNINSYSMYLDYQFFDIPLNFAFMMSITFSPQS